MKVGLFFRDFIPLPYAGIIRLAPGSPDRIVRVQAFRFQGLTLWSLSRKMQHPQWIRYMFD